MNRFSRAYGRAFETRFFYDAFMIDRRIRLLRKLREKAPRNSARRTVIDCWIGGLKAARDSRAKEDGFWVPDDVWIMEHDADMPVWALPVVNSKDKMKQILADDTPFWASWSVMVDRAQRACSALALKHWDSTPFKYDVFTEYWYTWRHDGERMQFLGVFPSFFEARQATA